MLIPEQTSYRLSDDSNTNNYSVVTSVHSYLYCVFKRSWVFLIFSWVCQNVFQASETQLTTIKVIVYCFWTWFSTVYSVECQTMVTNQPNCWILVNHFQKLCTCYFCSRYKTFYRFPWLRYVFCPCDSSSNLSVIVWTWGMNFSASSAIYLRE